MSPDDSVDLFTWDMAEAGVTIIAQCIPILRTLIAEWGSTSRRSNLPQTLPRTTSVRDGVSDRLAVTTRNDRKSLTIPDSPASSVDWFKEYKV
jgi:hypothetical protein